MIFLSQDKELMGYRLLDACPFLAHFVTTRQGGVSQGNYASFNCSPYTDDTCASVRHNQSHLFHLMGDAIRELVLPHQTHGCESRVIDADYFRRPVAERREVLEGVDALITDCRGVCIGVTTADCVPVLLCDTRHRVVAAIHAGWKGTVQHIVSRTLQRLHAEFGTDGADVVATVGPSISFQSFEVGDEVVEAFSQAGFEMDTLARRFPDSGKYHIDLWEANRRELLQFGVPAAQIETAGICTYQHPEQFFSARRLGIHSGRILSGIMLR